MTDSMMAVVLPKPETLDAHDQAELKFFEGQVADMGLGYALWRHRPEFHDPALQSVVEHTAAGYDVLLTWLDKHMQGRAV